MNVSSVATPVFDRYPIIVSATALGVLILMVLLVAGAPVYTEDLWWHLKAGEMYATEGPWPSGDWMLHTARADAPIQHEWLFGVSVDALERLIGFHGLRVIHAAAAAFIIWLALSIFRRSSAAAISACLATCVFVVLASPRLFQLRPDLVSIAATLVGYRLLLESGKPPTWRRIAAYGLLIVVWVNFHSLFLVSLNLLVAALLGIVLAAALHRFIDAAGAERADSDAQRARLGMRLGAALAVGLLLALLNPRGIEQHLTFLSSTRDSPIWRITDEWSHFHPFDFAANHRYLTRAMWLAANGVILAFLASSAIAFIRFARRRRVQALDAFDSVHFALACAAIVAMLVSIRFLWMGVFPLVYVLRSCTWMQPLVGARASIFAAWSAALAGAALAAWFSLGHDVGNLVSRFATSPGQYLSMPYRTHKFHAEGVHFLAASGLEGNLFNSYAMGGFLGYWLAPRLRTFVDGRAEHYDNEVHLDYSAITEMRGRRAGETFLDVLDRRNVDIFFGIGFPGWWHSVFTTTHLDRVPGWIPVSRSFRHAIYLRDDERNRENLARVAAYYDSQGIPFGPKLGFDPSAAVRARPDWAIEHAMLPGDYYGLVEQASSEDPETRLKARTALGLAYLLTGAYAEQIAWDLETAEDFPQDARSRQRLVYALLRVDAVDEARAVLEALAEIAPNDRWTRDLARLVTKYRRFSDPRLAASDKRAVQVRKNHLLWKRAPITIPEAWAIEHAMHTEVLSPDVTGG